MSTARKLFWSKVRIAGLDDCWEWTRSKYPTGYGQFGGRRFGLSQQAHRTAYLLTHGEIPRNQYVLHSCNNPGCCNPTHLRADTQKENMLDMVNSGRSTRGSKNPMNKLTEDQVRVILLDSRTQREIAKDYSVGQQCISRIKTRKMWKYVQY